MVSFRAISDRPHLERLRSFVEALLERHGDAVSFIVVFGSMARGDFGLGSDYDVLVGLRRADDERFLDRLGTFARLAPCGVDVFPYTLDEIKVMESNYHLTLLEALDHGITLLDDGTFAAAREKHATRKAAGAIERLPVGWRLRPDRDPFRTGFVVAGPQAPVP